MKKALLFCGVLLCIGTMTLAGTGTFPVEPEAKIRVAKKGSTISVFYSNTEASLVRISILDEAGKSVFTDYVKNKKGFVKPYDVSRLPEGSYVVAVTDKAGNEFKEEISISEDSFAYNVTRLGGMKYALFVPSSGAKGLEVFIYNKDGVLVYRKTEKVKEDFAKVYNLSKHSGEVKIVVIPVL